MGTLFEYATFYERFDVEKFKRRAAIISMTNSVESELSNIRKTMNELLDKQKEELYLLKQKFIVKEEEYLKKIRDLENKLIRQKREHKDQLDKITHEGKDRKRCHRLRRHGSRFSGGW